MDFFTLTRLGPSGSEQIFDGRDDADLLVDLAGLADAGCCVARQDLEDPLGGAPDAGERAVDVCCPKVSAEAQKSISGVIG